MKTKALCVIGLVFLLAFGCSTDKGVNDDGNGDENDNWTITLKPMSPKIYSGKEIEFTWTVDPVMMPGELVVITIATPIQNLYYLRTSFQEQQLIHCQ